MNQFGGNWTQQKIEMVVAYAKAYLIIMNKYPQYKPLYFDGFAGSGDIYKNEEIDLDIIKGAAVRILEINDPKSFDTYYFVEKDEKNKTELEKTIKQNFPNKKTHVVAEDCNRKLVSMAKFLKEHPEYRVLAFIDPYGMALDWRSIECLKGLGIDLWILVPTGMGINRLLKKDGKISDAWLEKLERFLGLRKEIILNHFYKESKSLTLFGEETIMEKEENAIAKAGDLYRERLNTVFKSVSEPFIMKNSTNSIMYHFIMASNNNTAIKIANDVIKPKYKS
ncbi:MAG: three-Cys-motif partner protein TcmP [Ferruginibacter sp.]